MPNVDMRRYWLPDYEKKLIGELQKQQNSAQFCDTVLQTEGISIPTHSSVLAALSHHLSQRLFSSPAPLTGEKRRLQLHTLKPQTLIKLVGLLYSGELEVNSALEQRDVLAAAHLFGLPELVEGEKENVGEGTCGCKKYPEKDVERGNFEKRDAQIQVRSSGCVSVGTQTILEDNNRTIDNSQHQQTAHSSSLPCVSLILRPENISSNTLSSTTTTALTRIPYANGDFTIDQSSDGITSATSSLLCPSDNMTLHLSPSEDSNSPRLQEENVQQNVPQTSSVELFNESPSLEEDESRNKVVSENSDRTNHDAREGPAVGVEKRIGSMNVASKSLEKMQEMMEATQISIKVKLRRRRTKEEMWEVVNMQQDADETLSVVTSLRQDGSSNKRSQVDLTAVQPSPSTTQVCQTQSTAILQPITSSPKTVPQINDSCCPNTEFVSTPLQPSRPVEETDEQIEKLLEDIMIGLNILPNLDKDKSSQIHHSSCLLSKDKSSYCTCYEDYENQSRNSSTDTAQSEPVCTGPCGANGVLLPTQHNSSGSTRRKDGPQSSLHQKASTEPSLGEQLKLHFPADHESTPQEDPNDLEFLPLSNDNEVHLFSIADLQFPPCLSPINSVNNNSISSGHNKTPAQSTLPGRAWLSDNPGSLEFPLSNVAQKFSSSPSKQSAADENCKEKTSEAPPGTSQHVKDLRKINRNFPKDVVPRNRKRKCTHVESNKTCSDVNVRTGSKIKLSPCSVSMSSNNVLAKERLSSSLKMAPNMATETSQQPTITRSLRTKAKSSVEILPKAPIRTKKELGNSQKTQSCAIPELASPKPASSETDIELKKIRRRPRKTQGIKFTSPNTVSKVATLSQSGQQNPHLEGSEEAKSKTRKRSRPKDMEESQLTQAIPTNDSYAPKDTDANNNTAPAEKRPRMVSLKEFQELIKRQHPKTKRSKLRSSEKEEREHAEDTESEDALVIDSIQETETNSQSEEVDVTNVCDERGQDISTPQLLELSEDVQETPQEDSCSSPANEKTDSAENNGLSPFSLSVLEKEVAKLSEEKKTAQEVSNDASALDSLDEGELIIDEDDDDVSSQLDTHLQRENVPANHSLNPQSLINSDAGELEEAVCEDRILVCQQEEEEVDVLLHSPDESPATIDTNQTVEISPDEEEEDDSNDVDVTGDDTDCLDV